MNKQDSILEGLFGITEPTTAQREILGFNGGMAIKQSSSPLDVRAIISREPLVSDLSNLKIVPKSVLANARSITTAAPETTFNL